MEGNVKRATIYLDAHIHRILKLKAVETGDTISNLVNAAIRQSLHEDLSRLDGSRLARECERLDPESETALANEGLNGELEQWPDY
jgi:hypothetical protein